MSTPAGWYDDGSGRQRWWDGAQWTEHFAPAQNAPVPAQVVPAQPVPSQPAPAPQEYATAPAMPAPVAPGASVPTSGAPTPGASASPVLGFVGLGLAVLGAILACIPAVFGLGVVVLLAGFVISLIGLFKKGTAKWPSIAGVIVSVLGGVLGTVILVVSLVVSLGSNPVGLPTGAPTPTTEQPSESRPSPEVIAVEFEKTAHAGGMTNYDDMPDFYPCMGQELYDSDLSDESLWLVVTGEDPLEPERELAEQAIMDAVFTCDPDGEGAWG